MPSISKTLFLLALLSAASALHADAQLLAERQALTLEAAKVIASAAEEEARSNEWTVVIAIVDAGGHLLYLQRMDGVQLASLEVAQQKARAAALYRRPTKAFSDLLAGGSEVPKILPGVIPLEGGLPIVVDEVVIGAIGVSGVRASEDAQIGQAGIDALMERLGR